jgi:hypothetical protein
MRYGLEDMAWLRERDAKERSERFKSYICQKGKSKRTKKQPRKINRRKTWPR